MSLPKIPQYGKKSKVLIFALESQIPSPDVAKVLLSLGMDINKMIEYKTVTENMEYGNTSYRAVDNGHKKCVLDLNETDFDYIENNSVQHAAQGYIIMYNGNPVIFVHPQVQRMNSEIYVYPDYQNVSLNEEQQKNLLTYTNNYIQCVESKEKEQYLETIKNLKAFCEQYTSSKNKNNKTTIIEEARKILDTSSGTDTIVELQNIIKEFGKQLNKSKTTLKQHTNTNPFVQLYRLYKTACPTKAKRDIAKNEIKPRSAKVYDKLTKEIESGTEIANQYRKAIVELRNSSQVSKEEDQHPIEDNNQMRDS